MVGFRKWMLLVGASLSFSTFADKSLREGFNQLNSNSAKIHEIVDSYVSSRALDGGVILVAKSGNVIYEGYYGLADSLIEKPINRHNSFQIASLSKPITAALVLKLEEQGILKLDSTLADYFPEFDNASGKKITLHHLLSHTSGIPNHFVIDGWFDADFHRKTSELEFTNIIANHSPLFEPGEKYLYSNLGYFLLGKIIEKSTKESFFRAIQKYIYEPLSMTESGVAIGFQSYPNIVKGYQWKEGGGYKEQISKNMSLFGAGASIYTTGKDLHRFDLALYGDDFLTNKSKKRLFSPHYPYSWRVGNMPITQDLNVNVHTYDGKFDGYSAMMTRFIDDKHSIIILSNTGISYFLKQQLTLDIAGVLYGKDAPNRKHDSTLSLIKGVVSGNFSHTLNSLKSEKNEPDFNEQSLSSLAFELLWANIGIDSLKLFDFINNKFPNSSKAKLNLKQACDHRLTKKLEIRVKLCK